VATTVLRVLVLPVCLLTIFGSTARAQFAVGNTFAAPEHPNSVTVADFDGDSWLDLAVPSYSPNTLTIFRNDGHGGFLPPVIYAAGSGPRFGAQIRIRTMSRSSAATATARSRRSNGSPLDRFHATCRSRI
jgi:hypothetical protein